MSELLENKATRLEYCKHDKYMFFLYYFTDYFTSPSADFHKQWAKEFMFKDHSFFINLGFRDSAKTVYSIMDNIHDICYENKHFLLWISYDKDKAEANLFDLVVELQTNKKLIEDFGLLFKGEKKDMNKIEKKSVKEFVTTNDIKVLAYGTKGSLRGVHFGKYRPDKYTFDDIENEITKKSSAITRGIVNFIDEAIGGMASYADCIFNCNYISEFGVVRYLLDKAEKSKNWSISWVNAEENGKPTWSQRFTMTNQEAVEKNLKIKDKRKRFVSLEQKREDLGQRKYDQEMMNKPVVRGERFFDVDKVDARIQYIKDNNIEPKIINGWKFWGEYKSNSSYGMGADVAEGVRADSACLELYDFTKDFQVAELVSDEIDPRDLGDEMVLMGNKFGSCVLCPENNSIGGETVRQIKANNYKNIYRHVIEDKITKKLSNEFGWKTNKVTKSEMLINFRDQFESGQVEINSLLLLYEMRAFTRSDLKIESIYDDELSNHFDRVMGFAITLMLRDSSKPKEDSTSSSQNYIQKLKKLKRTLQHQT